MYSIVVATSKNWYFYLLHTYCLEPGVKASCVACGFGLRRDLELVCQSGPFLLILFLASDHLFLLLSKTHVSQTFLQPVCLLFFLKHFWFLLPNLSISQHSAAFRASFICRDSLQSVKALVIATAHCTCLHKLNGFYMCFWSSHHSKE